MCKQTVALGYCSELGADASLWSGQTPIPKPNWIGESLTIFIAAFREAINGNVEASASLLANSPDSALRDWFDVHGQNSGTWRYKALRVGTPEKSLPLDPMKSFSRYETSLFARDNFRCRYCGSQVIPKKVFTRFQEIVGKEILPLGGTNANRSGYSLMFYATLDHVFPHSLGGRTDEGNLVTCCWSCNYGKMNYTLEQLGLVDPFSRPPISEPEWSGLTDYLAFNS